jgi:hypothetical protein
VFPIAQRFELSRRTEQKPRKLKLQERLIVGKQVPLTIYKGGTRTEVGKASIAEDGSIVAQVAKDHWPQVKDIIRPGYEISIGPFIASRQADIT